MMPESALRAISWVLGITAVVAMVLFFQPTAFLSLIKSVGIPGIGGWIALTVSARLIQGEATVVPMTTLGFPIKRADVFWIGWIRTFANQLLPLSGVVAYAHALRSRTSISWSELAALAAPQFVLAATALGLIGLVAISISTAALGGNIVPLISVYSGVTVVSIALIHGSPWIIRCFPRFLSERARQASQALVKIAATPGQILRLVAYHSAVIVLRGIRIWLLFSAADTVLSWQDALLLIAIAESTILVQITPGGLGIREGAIIGGAALVGIPADIATGVAILDRLLVIALIALLTPPSIAILKAPSND